MDIYNIEGGVNFYDELYKSLDDEEDTNENENTCLISNLPLTDLHFEMQCGHKFNYMPLFLDIKNHKQKFNSLEGSSSKLGHNQIRCPYCRGKHLGTLPYHEELGLSKIHGVNFFDPDFKSNVPHKFSNNKCEFLVPNQAFNENETNIDVIGTNPPFYKCTQYGTKLNLYNDEKHYCYCHTKLVVKIYKKDIATKINEAKKQALIQKKEEVKQLREKDKQQKQLEKQQAKQQAINEKQQAKQQAINEKQQAINEKQQAKIEKKSHIVNKQNVVDLDLTEINTELCVSILRTGPKKGQQCGCKIENDGLCKRHYNMKHHKIKNAVITI